MSNFYRSKTLIWSSKISRISTHVVVSRLKKWVENLFLISMFNNKRRKIIVTCYLKNSSKIWKRKMSFLIEYSINKWRNDFKKQTASLIIVINIKMLFFENVDFRDRYIESKIVFAQWHVISNNESIFKVVCLNVNFDINKFIYSKKVCKCQAKCCMYIDIVWDINIQFCQHFKQNVFNNWATFSSFCLTLTTFDIFANAL